MEVVVDMQPLCTDESIHCPKTENTGSFYQIYILQSEGNASNPHEVMSASPLEKYLSRVWLNLLLQAKNFELS